MSNVTDLTEKEFEKFTKTGKVLVDFFADWCMPCITMGPIMEEISAKFKGKIRFAKIDVDESQKLAQKFKVLSIPNFVLFQDGKVKEQFVGAMDADDFEERLRKHL